MRRGLIKHGKIIVVCFKQVFDFIEGRQWAVDIVLGIEIGRKRLSDVRKSPALFVDDLVEALPPVFRNIVVFHKNIRC